MKDKVMEKRAITSLIIVIVSSVAFGSLMGLAFHLFHIGETRLIIVPVTLMVLDLFFVSLYSVSIVATLQVEESSD